VLDDLAVHVVREAEDVVGVDCPAPAQSGSASTRPRADRQSPYKIDSR
jgi:hypothetical protein